jgi:hypothetical protein
MSSTQVQHNTEQTELTGKIPYEVRVEQRILKAIAKEPGVTPDTLRHRVGFVLDGCYQLALDRLIETGVIASVPTKYGLTVVGQAAV